MVKLGTGWRPPEDYFHAEDGTYPVTLIRIGVEDRDGDFDPEATRSFNGQFGEKVVQDWRFQAEDGTYIDAAVAVPYVDAQGEQKVGRRSTYWAYSCALAGKSLEGVDWDPQKHLVGRMALATIERDDDGVPRIRNLGAVPKAMLSKKVAEATGAPLKAEPKTVQETVEAGAGTDSLPF